MLVRVQGVFPATGEVLAPFTIGHYVAGFMRGSHLGPLMPVVKNSTVSYFDGPPVVRCLAFWIHKRRLATPADAFDRPYGDWVRSRIAGKATEIRTQGFFGAAMLPYSELEYGGIVVKMNKLEKKIYGEKTGVKNIPLQTLIDCLLFFLGLDLISQHYSGDSAFHD